MIDWTNETLTDDQGVVFSWEELDTDQLLQALRGMARMLEKAIADVFAYQAKLGNGEPRRP
ncbi:MAG: hypothetical protein ACHQ0J_13465 [Candidatus Dormibacterales bacterium]